MIGVEKTLKIKNKISKHSYVVIKKKYIHRRALKHLAVILKIYTKPTKHKRYESYVLNSVCVINVP